MLLFRWNNETKLKEIAKELGLQARGIGGEHSAMDSEGTADISPSARFGVTEATVTKRLFEGLVRLYAHEAKAAAGPTPIVFKEDARKLYLDSNGKVDFDKV